VRTRLRAMSTRCSRTCRADQMRVLRSPVSTETAVAAVRDDERPLNRPSTDKEIAPCRRLRT
jgi:hypothetical protein